MPDIFGPLPPQPERNSSADYRDKTTQVRSFVRNKLKECDYIRFRNRVNQGPWRNHRARLADRLPQIPHVLASDDLWGWQNWTSASNPAPTTSPFVNSGLFESTDPYEVPGESYEPYQAVGGASYVRKAIPLQPSLDSPFTQDIASLGRVSISQAEPEDRYVLMFDANANIFRFVPLSTAIDYANGL